MVRWEIARFVVNRLAPADFRSVAFSTSLSGFWRLAPISQIQSSTETEGRETVRKYRKGIGGCGAKSEAPTLENQRVGHRLTT